jgi:bifunctional DNA-binding transcriptional regulator/antitoxin component of YhaV-PrlF toxin-antitoxin module
MVTTRVQISASALLDDEPIAEASFWSEYGRHERWQNLPIRGAILTSRRPYAVLSTIFGMDVDAEDGRICLPKHLREKFGHRFELVDRGDRLVLVPVAEDPLEALREEFQDVDASPEELKQGALDEAGS